MTQTKQKTSSGSWLLLAGAVVIVFAIASAAKDSGWLDGNPDPETNPNRGDQKIVTFTAHWGQIRDLGGVHEDTGKKRQSLRCEPRELTITYYIDGEPHAAQQNDSEATEPCEWKHTTAVHPGAEVRLLVEEVGGGGWKMCLIEADGTFVLPNGWAIAPQGADCDVWGVVL